jgi:hypothetical protein
MTSGGWRGTEGETSSDFAGFAERLRPIKQSCAPDGSAGASLAAAAGLTRERGLTSG